MSQINPQDVDHIAGTHSTRRPETFNAYADRIDQFLNGLEAGWLAEGTLPETVRMALTSVRTGLDLLGDVVEDARHAQPRMAAVTS